MQMMLILLMKMMMESLFNRKFQYGCTPQYGDDEDDDDNYSVND
jgi:hypothetical protein